MISYIYIDEDDNIGVGRVHEDDIEIARQEVIENIRISTDLYYICITSSDHDFVEESKEYEDINEYFTLVKERMGINGNDISNPLVTDDAGVVS